MNELGDFLKQLRGKMTFREAAEKSGVSHAYIRYLEIGKRPGSNTPINPSPEMLKGLAKAYNHSYKDLMMRAGYSYDEEVNATINGNKDDSLYVLKRMIDHFDIDLTEKDKLEKLEKLMEIFFPLTKD